MNLTAIDLCLKVAQASVGAGEVGGPNAGPYVERVQRVTGNKRGDAWCASDVAAAASIALGDQWPLPLSGRVQDLVDYAIKHRCFYEVSTVGLGVPQRGDLHVLWHPELKRYAHTGWVFNPNPVDTFEVEVLDGNTTDPRIHNTNTNDRDGWLKVQKVRTLTPSDGLIRWIQLVK